MSCDCPSTFSLSYSSSFLGVPFPPDRPNQHLAVLLPNHLSKVCLYLRLYLSIFILIHSFVIARLLFLSLGPFILSSHAALTFWTQTCRSTITLFIHLTSYPLPCPQSGAVRWCAKIIMDNYVENYSRYRKVVGVWFWKLAEDCKIVVPRVKCWLMIDRG